MVVVGGGSYGTRHTDLSTSLILFGGGGGRETRGVDWNEKLQSNLHIDIEYLTDNNNTNSFGYRITSVPGTFVMVVVVFSLWKNEDDDMSINRCRGRGYCWNFEDVPTKTLRDAGMVPTSKHQSYHRSLLLPHSS